MFDRLRHSLTVLGRLTPMGLVAIFLPMVGSALLIAFLPQTGAWLRENWLPGIFLVYLGIIVFCGLALLPTNVVGILCGWAFGFPVGLLVLITGTVTASIISFGISERISGDQLPELLKHRPRLQAIHTALLRENFRKTTLIIFLLRVSVIMPFALNNLLLAASRVDLRAYIAGTTLGHLPRAAAVAFIGSGLYELDLADTRDATIFGIGVAATIVSIIVIGVLSRKALERITVPS
ncbi:MAG: VTT domain-containing protein [Pyrinomonadaceae bacterium]